MVQESIRDVAIVGGGHVGLALALSLVRLLGPELKVAVVDRMAPAASDADAKDPRSFALSAGSRNLLQEIGIWPRLADKAEPVTAIEITDSALEHAVRPVLLAYDNRVDEGEPASWIVEARHLRRAMVEVLAETPAIEVIAPVEVAAVAVDEVAASIGLADGRSVRARLLVAADGSRSKVREAAGLQTVAWSYDQVGICTTVRHERPHKGRAVQHFLPGGPFAMLPLPGDRSCITWSEGADEARRILALDDAGFLAEAERRFGYKLGRITLDGPRAGWPLRFHMARALIGRRVALTGDAARTVHPIAGQGLNLGLRDAAALAEVVADSMRCGLDPGDATGLERYERWRRFDSSVSAAVYGALNTLFSNDSTLLRAVRDAGLGIVDRLPGLKQVIVTEAAGLSGEIPRLMRGAHSDSPRPR
jgi:2-octaprenyl-6-methoxyphenol hydroxylase